MSAQARARKYFDCHEFDRHGDCSLKLSGTEAEVLAAALEHAISSHGYRGWEDLRTVLRAALKDEATYAPRTYEARA
jgi:hypothetical protein